VRTTLLRYFLPNGRPAGKPYLRAPMPSVLDNHVHNALSMLGSFVEVFLAKEGHSGKVGVNLLTKVQLPNLSALYGAMLAGVDNVLMGAGIPREVPGALDRLAQHAAATFRLDITKRTGSGTDADADAELLRFDPADFGAEGMPHLRRPDFYPIVSSHSLASMLQKKANGSVEGFIVEGPTAGGHNAPPRSKNVLDELGQPVYGERDAANLDKIAELGLPFWLAGSYGSPEGLERARSQGAAGIQVGTMFAYSRESGITPGIKRAVLEMIKAGRAKVFTDPLASPTGFPFKVVEIPGTISEESVYEERRRVCDLGYLREVYEDENGNHGYRCASEPVADYVRKGGKIEDTVGRKCLCNALMADVGLGQSRKSRGTELPLVTSGDDLAAILPLLGSADNSYGAADVVQFLLTGAVDCQEVVAGETHLTPGD
jgi:NAD(P)H-dependent flavin oxidoreductase YrpB (nitropropane dioxygenase family)